MSDDPLARLSTSIEELQVRHQERKAAAIAKYGPANGWIKREAVEIFEIEGHECWIVKNGAWDEFDKLRERFPDFPFLEVGYNGYAVWKERPLVEPGFYGVLAYVPVHGGITYAEHDELGTVYGFDTAHANSEGFPIRDIEWIKHEILMLILGVEMAAKIEPEYLAADGDNQRRAELVQPLIDLAEGGLNFGTMLNLMSGEL
jgi:hypothetical protein